MNEDVVDMNIIDPERDPLAVACRRQHGPAQTPTLTLSIPEVATLLAISNNLAYEAAARGEIPTVRIGRRVLVPKAALNRLLGAEAA